MLRKPACTLSSTMRSAKARVDCLGARATVLDGIMPTMRLYRDESFGPVVGIIRVADEEEAIEVGQ